MARRRDYVDLIAEQWANERPEIDTDGVQVIGRISRLARYLERAIETSFAPRLNSSGFYVLAALRRSGPPYRLSPTSLYSSLLVSSGAMTNRIDRLERMGLIRRVADPADGRSSLVSLTRKGHEWVNVMIERHAQKEIRLLHGLTRTERTDLGRLLRKLLLSLDDHPAAKTNGGTRPRG